VWFGPENVTVRPAIVRDDWRTERDYEREYDAWLERQAGLGWPSDAVNELFRDQLKVDGRAWEDEWEAKRARGERTTPRPRVD
jgi:hypothetical protein